MTSNKWIVTDVLTIPQIIERIEEKPLQVQYIVQYSTLYSTLCTLHCTNTSTLYFSEYLVQLPVAVQVLEFHKEEVSPREYRTRTLVVFLELHSGRCCTSRFLSLDCSSTSTPAANPTRCFWSHSCTPSIP